MSEESLDQRVRRRIKQVGEDLASAPARARAAQPTTGELWVLPTKDTFGIQWMALADQGADRWELVAADTFPLWSAGDVALPSGSALGALRIRPRFRVTVPTSELTIDRYSGRVPAAIVDEIRSRSAVKPPANGARDELDEPSYERWITDCLEPATRALQDRFGIKPAAAEPGTVAAAATPPRPRNPSKWRSSARLLALAAAALVVAGLSVLTGLQSRKIAQLEAMGAPSGNLPMVWLGEEQASRSAQPARIAPGRSPLLLLMVEPPELTDSYRLEVLDQEGSEVWSSDEMILGNSTELAVILPVAQLAGRELRIRLVGLAEGQAKLLAEYVLTVMAG